jgi:hypothetical protein
MRKAVLLDTSFFLRFLNDDSPLFKNADGYFRYFLQNGIDMIKRNIDYYLSSDIESLKIYKLLKEQSNPKFQFIDLSIPFNEMFGVLAL